jgi:hypothetical protein
MLVSENWGRERELEKVDEKKKEGQTSVWWIKMLFLWRDLCVGDEHEGQKQVCKLRGCNSI